MDIFWELDDNDVNHEGRPLFVVYCLCSILRWAPNRCRAIRLKTYRKQTNKMYIIYYIQLFYKHTVGKLFINMHRWCLNKIWKIEILQSPSKAKIFIVYLATWNHSQRSSGWQNESRSKYNDSCNCLNKPTYNLDYFLHFANCDNTELLGRHSL